MRRWRQARSIAVLETRRTAWAVAEGLLASGHGPNVAQRYPSTFLTTSDDWGRHDAAAPQE